MAAVQALSAILSGIPLHMDNRPWTPGSSTRGPKVRTATRPVTFRCIPGALKAQLPPAHKGSNMDSGKDNNMDNKMGHKMDNTTTNPNTGQSQNQNQYLNGHGDDRRDDHHLCSSHPNDLPDHRSSHRNDRPVDHRCSHRNDRLVDHRYSHLNDRLENHHCSRRTDRHPEQPTKSPLVHMVINTASTTTNNTLRVFIFLAFLFNNYHDFDKMSRMLKRFTGAKTGVKSRLIEKKRLSYSARGERGCC